MILVSFTTYNEQLKEQQVIFNIDEISTIVPDHFTSEQCKVCGKLKGIHDALSSKEPYHQFVFIPEFDGVVVTLKTGKSMLIKANVEKFMLAINMAETKYRQSLQSNQAIVPPFRARY